MDDFMSMLHKKISFFAKMQSPVCPPERIFALRYNLVKHYVSMAYKEQNGY